ncbi:MAG: carboxypeptidase-like regulatory domain-containing protein [Gemmataceae bacterium]|nr:carboxypeptidase-like regulatory domain-containing protein [Gemmataceae bacterium]
MPDNVKLTDKDSATVGLVPVDKTAKGSTSGPISPGDGSFTLKDVPPGKYNVTVSLQGYPGDKDSAKRDQLFAPLNKAYGAAGKKQLSYDVTSDPNQSITIDLKNGSVTKS